ncbi:MAG TPA: outer membrane beta-barrel family protein [Sediminibacterium sp.]|nr:outer membrane beta-barrel family protein [Sediminibacterium sp.]
MRRLSLLLLCTCLLYTGLNAQSKQGVLKGYVTDTLNKQNLGNAVIALLRPKDSVLLKYTRTDQSGKFEIPHLSGEKYLVMISYPGYADFVDIVEVAGNRPTDMGKVVILTKATLLQEVIVKQNISAMRMKGDTTEYRADSFKVSANADVQELLRKMPGIQVNSKGEITAQGERVQKVLVDGEEFFSDDPAVVTKNLRADAVDKVQSFDKKTDQAAFTGIDDGQKIKTLNIQLKEDKKKGYFGKAEAGTDFDKYRYGKLLGNAFKGKRKVSGYLTTDNTRFESLNWDENRNYAGDANITTEVTDDGGIMMWSSGDEFSWGRGYPNSVTGGLHFSKKWNKDKHNSNNTYQFNQLDVTGITTSKTQNILPDTSFINTTEQNQDATRNRHKITSFYEWQIDSSSSLKLTVRGSAVNSNTRTNYLGRSISEDNKIINESDRTTSNVEDNNTLNNNLLWRKKFKKTGRTITVNSDFNFNNREGNGFLLAKNSYFDAGGGLTKLDNIDQKKVNKQQVTTVNSSLSYTEPLWKNTFLVLNYKLNVNKNDAERSTYTKNGSGKYETGVDSLSNHFIFNTVGHAGSVSFRYNVKKFNFNVGSGLGTTVYKMNDLKKNTDRSVTFNNFIPSFTFNFTPKQQRRVTLSYNGSTQNPNLQQIQPIIDNIDPLNITIGNPNLKQSFVNKFSFRASDFKVLKSRYMSVNVNYTQTNNAISNASFVDELGRRVSQAINVDGNYNLSAHANYGFDVVPSMNLSFGAGPSRSRYASKVNGVDNITENNSWNFSINSGYWSDKWINYWFNFDANYNHSSSSIRPDIVTKYWSYNMNSNLQFKFKKIKTYIDLELEANLYQKTSVFANQRDVYLVSGSVRKGISKNDQWEIKMHVNDIFNQNLGISRNVNSNFISETTNQTIQRYFLLSLIWNFNKNGKPANAGF